VKEYASNYDRAFKPWNLLETDIIEASSGHTTPLDPLAGFEEIMSRMPQVDTQDRSRPS
jgi:hypothetical protein